MSDGPFRNAELPSSWKRYGQDLVSDATSREERTTQACHSMIGDVDMKTFSPLFDELKAHADRPQMDLDPVTAVETIFGDSSNVAAGGYPAKTSDCESPGSTPSREGARSGARQHDKRVDRHHQKPARRRMHSCPRARRHEPRRLPEGNRAEPRDVRCHQAQRTLRRLGHRQQARVQAGGSEESRRR